MLAKVIEAALIKELSCLQAAFRRIIDDVGDKAFKQQMVSGMHVKIHGGHFYPEAISGVVIDDSGHVG